MNDLISRKALCDYALNQKDKSVTPNDIMRFPSAQPEREPGKWIYDGDCYRCNKCGAVYGWWADSQTSNFCPNCGADMRGEQDE